MRLISKHSLMLGTNSELKKNIRKEARSTNKLRQWQAKFLQPLSVKNWYFNYRVYLRERTLQPWKLTAAFGNAVVNVVLCWFYDGEKNAVVRIFTYAVFLFRFYSLVDNS